MIPVIIDADPGVDDAIAILMAVMCDDLDIKAITCVAGNQTIEKVTNNALRLVDISSKDIAVYMGAEKPIKRNLITAQWVHGISGLGDVELPETKRMLADGCAIDFIYEEAKRNDGLLHILAIGPLTNIALAIKKYPDITKLIKKIVLMGGSILGGNVTPSAEFNIYVDPEAAKIVFDSDIPIVMCGLDVTHKALVYKEDIEKIRKMNTIPTDVVADLLSYVLSFCEKRGYDGAVLHDPLATTVLINKSIIQSNKYFVDIETCGKLTRGETVVDVYNTVNKKANVDVGVDIDRDKFISLLIELLNKYTE